MALAGGHVGEQPHQVVEAAAERGPVLQVHRQPDPLPDPRGERLVRSVAGDRLVPALDVVQRRKHERRQRRADQQVIHLRVQARAARPLPLIGIHDATVVGIEVAGGAHVQHHHAHPAEVPLETPLRGAALGIGGHGEVGEDPLPLGIRVGGTQRLVDLVGLQLVGREIAEVLVDEVAGERADHAVTPPRLRGHLAAPRVRGVPVVAQVVVVEDHAARHGRQQPAHVRIVPRFAVQPGVLLEVADLLGYVAVTAGAGRVAHRLRAEPCAAPFRQSFGDVAAGDVRVHLVAEQQHRVGPLVVLGAGHLVGQGDQGVGADLAQRGRGLVLAAAARTERQPHGVVGARGADHAGPLRVDRPHRGAVQLDLVRGLRALRQVAQVQHGEVVTVHAPCLFGDHLVGGADRDPTRRGHLDPHRGVGPVDVPQHRADEDLRGRGGRGHADQCAPATSTTAG